MGLSNASKKARSYSQTINQNQGGGNKKAGFPHMIGRETNTSIAFNNTNVATGKCCKLSSYQTLLFTYKVSPSRGVGADVRIPLR
jgi:hypothetical protein